tara:strand:- start:6361 stop:6630 length:270 start_codon:yes stop_codon:yes gene_type:complete
VLKALDFELFGIALLVFALAIAAAFAPVDYPNWDLWPGLLVFLFPQGRLITRFFDYRKMQRNAANYFFVNQLLLGVFIAVYFAIVLGSR